ncbi:hypothetical protein CA51_16820 [Rosistilla oblonga]|uniref:hypothetical protein n=1 Tax=Rosistilla oblonga TaxID=2527990 RepID=UPI0011879812|nr:hypothetical protein [Rosistilla oblonga]QDV11806.1 hypothetical protein CA51_16820 [Rosistilla oblonga]
MALESAATTTTAKPSRTRSYLLFGILGLMIIALAYDYKVARPNVEQAYEDLVAFNMQVNADPSDMVTPEMVAEMLGKTPTRTFKDMSDFVEVYSWRGGLFFKSHDLYVAYRVTPLGTLMARTSKFNYDAHREVYEEVYARMGVELPYVEAEDGRYESPVPSSMAAMPMDPQLAVDSGDASVIAVVQDAESIPTVELALQE